MDLKPSSNVKFIINIAKGSFYRINNDVYDPCNIFTVECFAKNFARNSIINTNVEMHKRDLCKIINSHHYT